MQHRSPPNAAQQFMAEAEARLAALQQTTAMRGDPYVLALAALVACTRAVAASEAPAWFQTEAISAMERGAAAEARSLARRIDRRTSLWLALWIALGGLGGAVLAGGAILLAGSQWDAAAARFYAAMPVCRAR